MGSLFRKKGSEAPRKRSRHERLVAALPPPVSRDVEDRTAPMQAPLVDLTGKFPPELGERLGEQVAAGARAILVDPEDEETRIFAVFDDRLVEVGRCDVAGHVDLLARINACRGGSISVASRRYSLELTTSFSDFGDRLSIQLFEEGRFSTDDLLGRRKENIRLVNRLKPATSLTRKNELDIAGVVARNPREVPFSEVLVADGLVTREQVEQLGSVEDLPLAVLQEYIFPRKAAASALARYLGVEYLDVEEVSFSKPACRKLEKEWSLARQVVPFGEQDGALKVAMMDPTDGEVIREIEERTGLSVQPFCSAAQDIMVMIHKGHKDD